MTIEVPFKAKSTDLKCLMLSWLDIDRILWLSRLSVHGCEGFLSLGWRCTKSIFPHGQCARTRHADPTKPLSDFVHLLRSYVDTLPSFILDAGSCARSSKASLISDGRYSYYYDDDYEHPHHELRSSTTLEEGRPGRYRQGFQGRKGREEQCS